MPRPKKEMKANEEAHIRSLSLQEAKSEYKIGYRVWKRIKLAGFVPKRNRESLFPQETIDTVLESIRQAPHLATGARASLLGLRTESLQGLLKDQGLSLLNARLMHAGYSVEVIQPLRVARERRILAAAPGTLTHIDYKTFGKLRGSDERVGDTIGGYCVVDSFTGFAIVHLVRHTSPEGACAAVRKFQESAPFPVEGWILSDNGPTDFTTNAYIKHCLQSKLLCRTTHFSSPWSNGKVEALNKTLKYQCFPSVCLGHKGTLHSIRPLIDTWMKYYNTQRSHTGWINRGLPPVVLWDIWTKQTGTHLDRLVKMGLIEINGKWTVKPMGQNDAGNAGVQPAEPGHMGGGNFPRSSSPFAFVLQRAGALSRVLVPLDEKPSAPAGKLFPGEVQQFCPAK